MADNINDLTHDDLMSDKPKKTGNVVVDFLREIEKHVDKKNGLQRGDSEAWGEWFAHWEFLGSMSGSIADKLEAEEVKE